METFWGTLNILPVATVPVELLDTVRHITEALSRLAYIIPFGLGFDEP